MKSFTLSAITSRCPESSTPSSPLRWGPSWIWTAQDWPGLQEGSDQGKAWDVDMKWRAGRKTKSVRAREDRHIRRKTAGKYGAAMARNTTGRPDEATSSEQQLGHQPKTHKHRDERRTKWERAAGCFTSTCCIQRQLLKITASHYQDLLLHLLGHCEKPLTLM